MDSDLAQIALRLLAGKPTGLEGFGSIGRNRGLWVRAEDAVCDELDQLSYDLQQGSRSGEFELWVEATDCVGNSRRGRLDLVRQKK